MVCGQRQVGKTTMLNHIREENRKYVTFDDMNARRLAETDPELFFDTYGLPILIDEFQRVPSIFMEIKKNADERALNGESNEGLFWLTGSQKFKMMQNVAESLAGRIKGSMPKIISTDIERDRYYSDYVNTYLERDIKELAQVGKLNEFYDFLVFMAARTAQELKYSDISNAIGISAPTAKAWVTILERAAIIYILHPYSTNISKRLVKTPKVYFMDTGLAAYLCRWPNVETLEAGAMDGAFLRLMLLRKSLIAIII